VRVTRAKSNACTVVVKRFLEWVFRSKRRWDDNIKIYLRKIRWEVVETC
jgi:hypothetical protein